MFDAEAQNVLGEEVHHVAEFLQTVGADGGLVVGQLIDDGAGLEQQADDQRRGEVVVHGVVAALAQRLDGALRLGVALVGRSDAAERGHGVGQLLQAFLGGL